jgi:lipoprotein-releasing system ATP-binding protein
MTVAIVLQLHNISKSFVSAEGGESYELLHDISLSVQEGQVVALLGPSGCGKSTLLQICGLLNDCDTGAVTLAGNEFTRYDDVRATRVRLTDMGYIYQFHHLLPEFSVLENVMMPMLINQSKREEAALKAEKVLSALGLQDKITSMPSALSGGQQQRVAIARAIVHQPKLILADEPTGNLDEHNSILVFDALISLAKNQKIGILVATHNVELAKKADRMLMMTNGNIKEWGVDERSANKASGGHRRRGAARSKDKTKSPR